MSYRSLFLAAAAGCLLMVVMMAIWIRESRPASALERVRNVDHEGRSGYRVVFHDKVFIVFCLAAVLPVFCIGNFGSIYAVYITDFLGVPSSTWAYLLTLNALIVVVVQIPLVNALRKRNRMLQLAASSALLAVGIGGSAFAGPVWSLVAFIAILSLGETLLSPVASAEVAELAPEAVRGRYMGVWTVVWNGGAALGPAFGGWSIDTFGGARGVHDAARGGAGRRRLVPGAGAGLEPAAGAQDGGGPGDRVAAAPGPPPSAALRGRARPAGRGRAPPRR